MKLGIIGSGTFGKVIIRKFIDAGADISCICGHQNQNSFPETIFTSDVQSAIEASDAVAVLTPTGTHFEVAMRAVEAGKHVYVEKPMCSSYAQAVMLQEAVERMEITFMVGHCYVYSNVISQFIEEEFDKAICRQVIGVLETRVNPYWEVGVHLLAVLEFLGIDIFAYELIVNSALEPGLSARLYAVDGKELLFKWEGDIYLAECRHFLECIASGAKPLTGIKHGMNVIRTLENRYGGLHSMVYF